MSIITEIQHSSHCHRLKLVISRTVYECDGCKEYGSGARYRCTCCDYDLHKECALAPPCITHPFFKDSAFVFLEVKPNKRCDACRRLIEGFLYHCSKNNLDLHPCCTNLPHVLKGDGVTLRLHDKLLSEDFCDMCGMRNFQGIKGAGWSYRSTDGKYQFHVYCVKQMLVRNWERENFVKGDKNSLSSFNGKVNMSDLLHKSDDDESSCEDESGLEKEILLILVITKWTLSRTQNIVKNLKLVSWIFQLV